VSRNSRAAHGVGKNPGDVVTVCVTMFIARWLCVGNGCDDGHRDYGAITC